MVIAMDYKKKYKDALEKAKSMIDDLRKGEDILAVSNLESLFPELAESEDERIMKEIIRVLKGEISFTSEKENEKYIAWLEKQGNTNETIDRDKFAQGILRGAAINLITWIDYNAAEGNTCLSNMECKDIEDALVKGDWNKIYAYMKKKLERQDEQKHIFDFNANNWYVSKVDGKIHNIYNVGVEPKFKVGDFIVNDYCMGKVIDLTNDAYLLDTGQGIPFSCEHNVHLWTIADAKDGDVLVYNNSSVEIILLFKRWMDGIGEGAYSYAHTFKNEILFNDWSDCGYTTHPATKEQRDLLFAKMKEAGYTFDSEKKELKKISQRMISAEAKETLYDKPAWSEEDEHRAEDTIYFLDTAKKHYASSVELDACINWLKTIKQRIEGKQ